MLEQANKPKIVVHLLKGKVVGMYSDQRIDFFVFDESKDTAVEEDSARISLARMGLDLDERDLLKYGLAYAVDSALIEGDFHYLSN